MTPIARAALFLGALAVSAPALAAGDPAEGKTKAGMCRICHGIDGVARNPEAPNIGGEHFVYLQNQLRNFRSGKRTHEVMSVIAEGLSDEDIDDLSAWYSSIKFSVTVPE
ncbi:MAG: cytochrome C554 [Rhodobacterales bacterium CG18_big_fil_WC_8_21_14_2_50_71_9]|nr:MAG: cytochrome C554 [Rhodobacterales bacterium CG18_big_fil_WC_8_21_14_2_50_71_9]PIY73113.1 MAG: cytochrome C554 [Rhodobacterales bacterium CG_4_10_14_0_8_um_filter_70_9]